MDLVPTSHAPVILTVYEQLFVVFLASDVRMADLIWKLVEYTTHLLATARLEIIGCKNCICCLLFNSDSIGCSYCICIHGLSRKLTAVSTHSSATGFNSSQNGGT